ncbi:hypothetical protein [Escherichia coli]|uniref:hypothetical protein n=1 Tax=Escherichia coli TaxID=562 RepID=UPI001354E495|nr:hypothetical protein [Salmonella enterica]
MQHKAENRDTYMDRNGRWVRPLIAAVVILAAHAQLQIFGAAPAWLPYWLPFAAAAVAFCTSGVFAVFTDTLSARIVRVLAQVAAVAMVGVVIGSAVGQIGALALKAGQIGEATLKLANVDDARPAIEIAPGMAIKNGDGQATVSGFQKCSEQSGVMRAIFGSASTDGRNDCIVIEKDTQTLEVQVHTRDGNTYENSVETWKVVRFPEHPGRMAFTRPSGDYVTPVEK